MNQPHGVARDSSGFVIVSALLVVGLMTAVCITYMRHSSARIDGSTVSLGARKATQSAESTFQLALQSLLSGHGVNDGKTQATFKVTAGQKLPSDVSMQRLSANRASLQVSSLSDNGLGATKLIEVFGAPVPDLTQAEKLPTLTPSVSATLLSNTSVPKIYYDGSISVSDTDLYGLVIVRSGTRLTLDNVVIHGAIVSDDALNLNTWTYDPLNRAEIQVTGNLRIDPADFLPGVAILVPDGALLTWGEGYAQLGGDVVAHTLELDQGFVTGNIASVAPLVADAAFQHVGAGRFPRPWAEGLDLGDVSETEFVATVPLVNTVNSLQAIQDFSFTSRFGVK